MTTWTLFTDGTAAPNPGDLGVGVVVVAPDGARITCSERLTVRGCNTAAEAWALTTGLRLARSSGAARADAVIAHVDARVVIDGVQSGRAAVERLVEAFAALRAALADFDDVTLVWVPRHRNLEADALARAALGLPAKLPRWLREPGRRNPHG